MSLKKFFKFLMLGIFVTTPLSFLTTSCSSNHHVNPPTPNPPTPIVSSKEPIQSINFNDFKTNLKPQKLTLSSISDMGYNFLAQNYFNYHNSQKNLTKKNPIIDNLTKKIENDKNIIISVTKESNNGNDENINKATIDFDIKVNNHFFSEKKEFNSNPIEVGFKIFDLSKLNIDPNLWNWANSSLNLQNRIYNFIDNEINLNLSPTIYSLDKIKKDINVILKDKNNNDKIIPINTNLLQTSEIEISITPNSSQSYLFKNFLIQDINLSKFSIQKFAYFLQLENINFRSFRSIKEFDAFVNKEMQRLYFSWNQDCKKKIDFLAKDLLAWKAYDGDGDLIPASIPLNVFNKLTLKLTLLKSNPYIYAKLNQQKTLLSLNSVKNVYDLSNLTFPNLHGFSNAKDFYDYVKNKIVKTYNNVIVSKKQPLSIALLNEDKNFNLQIGLEMNKSFFVFKDLYSQRINTIRNKNIQIKISVSGNDLYFSPVNKTFKIDVSNWSSVLLREKMFNPTEFSLSKNVNDLINTTYEQLLNYYHLFGSIPNVKLSDFENDRNILVFVSDDSSQYLNKNTILGPNNNYYINVNINVFTDLYFIHGYNIVCIYTT